MTQGPGTYLNLAAGRGYSAEVPLRQVECSGRLEKPVLQCAAGDFPAGHLRHLDPVLWRRHG